MLLSIRDMLFSLKSENIVYCHWKSNQHLEEALNGDTDLDMIFKVSQRGEVEKVLNQCGLKRFRATPPRQYNGIDDFIGFDKQTAKIWHLHLHYRLTLGEKHLKGYTTPWGDYILSNRVYVKKWGVFCSRPEDEYFLLLLRMALKLRWRDLGRKIGKDDMAEIDWLRERTRNTEVVKTAGMLLGEECSRGYARILNGSLRSNKELFRLQRILRAGMNRFRSHHRVAAYLHRIKREIFWLLTGISRRLGFNSAIPGRRVSPSGGAVVAVLGCDGAGKSTTLAYLKQEFGKKIDIYSVYLGSGDGSSSILRYPLRIIAKKVGGKGLGDSIRNEMYKAGDIKPTLKARAYGFSSILWAIVLAMEKNRKLGMITKARNNGILVLADRYPQIEVMGYNDGPLLDKYIKSPSSLLQKIARWERKIYRSAYINPPDLVVKLTVPAAVALERKPAMTISEIENKRAAVKAIKLSANSVEIDTARDKILTFGEIMEQIWKIV